VKDISWKEVAEEDHAKGNEQATKYVVHHAETL
jgi:hypothetical protein